MADIILGRVRPVFTGDWDEERAYVLLDRFLYNNTLYECVKDAPAGTAIENTEYYVVVVEEGPQGPKGPPPPIDGLVLRYIWKMQMVHTMMVQI